jgi:hypothetical protein
VAVGDERKCLPKKNHCNQSLVIKIFKTIFCFSILGCSGECRLGEFVGLGKNQKH